MQKQIRLKSLKDFKNEMIDRRDGQRMTNYESAKIEAKNEGITAEELVEIWYDEEIQKYGLE